jgi:TonB-linked SusC/RagA family outer membrane protein
MKLNKRLRHLAFLTTALLALQLSAFAQQIVTGTIRTATGEPVIGATVTVKGTNVSVPTDANGRFRIEAAPGSTLVVTSVGFQQKEINAPASGEIEEVLQVTDASLNEVVVIGYQTVRKRDLTGATAVINPANALRVSSNSLAESIQGLAPGVNVRTGGAPGQNSVIEIRGVASFTNANPLYVIDGMIADANTTINTNDVASIQILKDASAAAIYGSRAANGVVIITTRQGKEGPAKVGAGLKFGVQKLPKLYDLMNNVEFAQLQRTQYENSGATPPASVGSAFDASINTDWQDAMLRTGRMEDYNVNLSGGGSNNAYLISASYFKNEGVLIGRSFNRASLRINSRSQKGRVSFGENLVISNSNVRNPVDPSNPFNAENPFYDFPQMLPVIPIKGPQYVSATNPQGWGVGSIDAPAYVNNPVAVNDLATRTANFTKLVGNAYLDVKILNWLNYRFNAGAEVSFDFIKDIRKDGIWEFNAAPRASSVDEERSRFLSLLFEHTLNFNKTFGDHAINGVVGYSQQNTSRMNTIGGRTNMQIFGGNYMTTVSSATGISTAGGGFPDDYRIYGYLGRLNYSFADKYLLTVSGRIDEDSRFGANYRRGFFPSAAVSWRISREDFFQADWISDLKLRASYGELGIVPLGSWDYTAFINNSPRAVFGPNQEAFIGSAQARLANPDLKWEERITKNIGVDASFLNNRISVSIDAYNSLSKDALLQLPVPAYLGNLQGNPFVNAGSIRNTGVEFAATYRNNTQAFKWDVSANFTTIKNKVEDVGNQGEGVDYIQVGNTRTKIGRSLGEWYLLRTDGLFQSQEEIDNYRNKDGIVIQPNARPGDVRYIDLDENGTITPDDRDFVGSPWPTLQAGAQFNGSWKNFSINVQFVGIFDYKVYNDVRRFMDSYQNTNFRKDISPWTPQNTGTPDPRIALATDQGIIDNNKGESDRWLEEGSYLRLRNLELGYSFEIDRLNISNARIFISGQNLFTITGYSGLDPDVTGLNLYERGLDAGHWPSSRVFSAGIQCEF